MGFARRAAREYRRGVPLASVGIKVYKKGLLCQKRMSCDGGGRRALVEGFGLAAPRARRRGGQSGARDRARRAQPKPFDRRPAPSHFVPFAHFSDPFVE